MAERTVAPYGSWASPFAIDRLTEGVVFISEVRGEGGMRWWLEGRPDESGRQILFRRDPDGSMTRLTPPGFNARCRVHEYGGAATLVTDDLVVVSDFTTGRLHRVTAPEELVPLTPDRAWRFADFVHDALHERLFAVREDHEPDVVAAHGEWVNELVTIDLATGEVEVVASGADFYAAPRLSPDGRRLCWLEWNHPNLPWDGTELKLAAIGEGGAVGPATTIAGSADDWISQPRWSPDGVLHFVAEPDGWMNLFRYHGGITTPIAPMAAEFASPDWIFGNAEYGFLDDGGILAVGRSDGRDHSVPDRPGWQFDRPGSALHGDRLRLDRRRQRAVLRADLAVRAGRGRRARPRDRNVEVLRRATPFIADRADVSAPRHVTFPSTGGRVAHANYYAPHNAAFRAPDGELPPLIVTSHGGPTAAASAAGPPAPALHEPRLRSPRCRLRRLAPATDASIASAERSVGDRGCRRLRGRRGVARRRRAWPIPRALRSGAARPAASRRSPHWHSGGVFEAGTTYFGIGDLRAFVKDTHKFESRYLETMVGPWPADAATLPRPLAGAARRPDHGARCSSSRARRIGSSRRPRPSLSSTRSGSGTCRTPTCSSPARTTASAAVTRSSGRSARSCPSTGRSSGSPPADHVEPVEIKFLDQARGRDGEFSPS